MATHERWASWQISYRLTLELYRATEAFPRQELYGLTSQIRRAAFSVVANIAEGSAKRGPRELRRYLDISLGSLAELACALRLARDLRYLSQDRWAQLEKVRSHAGALTWKLYAAVKANGR